jgi:hypothetical protein
VVAHAVAAVEVEVGDERGPFDYPTLVSRETRHESPFDSAL